MHKLNPSVEPAIAYDELRGATKLRLESEIKVLRDTKPTDSIYADKAIPTWKVGLRGRTINSSSSCFQGYALSVETSKS